MIGNKWEQKKEGVKIHNKVYKSTKIKFSLWKNLPVDYSFHCCNACSIQDNNFKDIVASIFRLISMFGC